MNWTELAEEITQQPASGSGEKLSGLVRIILSLLVVMTEAGFRVARSLTPEPQATCSRAGRATTVYC